MSRQTTITTKDKIQLIADATRDYNTDSTPEGTIGIEAAAKKWYLKGVDEGIDRTSTLADELMDDLDDEIRDLESDKEGVDGLKEEIKELEDAKMKMEAKEDSLPKLESLQDEIKAAISKRLCNNASIDQLEHFELLLAKKKGFDYQTSNDPIKPELLAAILAKR